MRRFCPPLSNATLIRRFHRSEFTVCCESIKEVEPKPRSSGSALNTRVRASSRMPMSIDGSGRHQKSFKTRQHTAASIEAIEKKSGRKPDLLCLTTEAYLPDAAQRHHRSGDGRQVVDYYLAAEMQRTRPPVEKRRTEIWANEELNGYNSIDYLPEYRTIPAAAPGYLLAPVGHKFVRAYPPAHGRKNIGGLRRWCI